MNTHKLGPTLLFCAGIVRAVCDTHECFGASRALQKIGADFPKHFVFLVERQNFPVYASFADVAFDNHFA